MHWGSLPIRKETTDYSIHFYIYTAMANHKIYYLLLFFLLPFSFLGAQNGVADQLLKATFHPSPQSAAYARYGEINAMHRAGAFKDSRRVPLDSVYGTLAELIKEFNRWRSLPARKKDKTDEQKGETSDA